MSAGGELGPPQGDSTIGTAGLMHHIGNDWPWHPGQMSLLRGYENHIGLLVEVSKFKFQMVAIPKRDVLHWGVLERRSVPTAEAHGRGSAAVGLLYGLMYGPIGGLLAASADARAEEKLGGKPAIGVTYQGDGEEHAFFLEWVLASDYRKAHALLNACLPGLLRE
jgi:hypothetical protein